MCFYQLPICAYPHRDVIRSLIFDPSKSKDWIECNKPKPWGRLSCGDLVIRHSTFQPDTQTPHIAKDTAGHLHGVDAADDKPFVNDAIRSLATDVSRDENAYQKCLWCTATLKVNAVKARYMQDDAEHQLRKMEDSMEANKDAREMYMEISRRERQLDQLRFMAWKASLADTQSSECHQQHPTVLSSTLAVD